MKRDSFDWRSRLPRAVLIACALVFAVVVIRLLHVHDLFEEAALVVSFLGGSLLLTASTFHPLYLLPSGLAAGASWLGGLHWEFVMLVAVIVTAVALWLVVPGIARFGSVVSYQRKDDSR